MSAKSNEHGSSNTDDNRELSYIPGETRWTLKLEAAAAGSWKYSGSKQAKPTS